MPSENVPISKLVAPFRARSDRRHCSRRNSSTSGFGFICAKLIVSPRSASASSAFSSSTRSTSAPTSKRLVAAERSDIEGESSRGFVHRQGRPVNGRTRQALRADVPIESSTSRISAMASSRDTLAGGCWPAMSRARARASGAAGGPGSSRVPRTPKSRPLPAVPRSPIPAACESVHRHSLNISLIFLPRRRSNPSRPRGQVFHSWLFSPKCWTAERFFERRVAPKSHRLVTSGMESECRGKIRVQVQHVLQDQVRS